jgi:cytochrome c oxidase assembly protein subunit 15
MFGTGMAAIKDWKFAKGTRWSGYAGKVSEAVKNPNFRSFCRQSWALTGLVLLTAISGKEPTTKSWT